MTDNKPLSKEDVGSKYGLMMHDPIQSHHICRAMDEWADIKLGEYIARQNSITETTVVPKHILEEYAKKRAIAFWRFCEKRKYKLTLAAVAIYDQYINSGES